MGFGLLRWTMRNKNQTGALIISGMRYETAKVVSDTLLAISVFIHFAVKCP